MPGLLRVRGTIDLEQFWPAGESDADTTKIKVTVGDGSFAFAADGKTFKKTNAYVGAFSRGASNKQVIDGKGRITVRLQGIDAPELHYRAAPLRRAAPSPMPSARNSISKTRRSAANIGRKRRPWRWRKSCWSSTTRSTAK